MSRILITGGAGFVGANLARQIQEEDPDADLLVIDDFRTGTFANLAAEGAPAAGDGLGEGGWSFRGEVIARSLLDLDLFTLVEDFEPEVIFHQASITDTTLADEARMIADNVEPFEALVNIAVESGIKLVWASSGATYGTRANGAVAERRPFQVDDAGHPANVYGFSKWVMENIARRTLAANPEAHIVGLRYFNVFGPGERHKNKMASMIFQLAQQMLAGQRPRVFWDGEQARDHVHVGDVVDATLAAAADNARSGVYNVGTGKATSFNQVIDALNEALGTQLQPEYIENPFKFYQPYTCADISLTRKGLGWTPRHETRQAILEYARWLKGQAEGR